MAFEPGKSGNPNGRPKGAIGTLQKEVKEGIAQALSSRSHQIAEKLDQIENPVKWLEVYSKLAAYLIPKQARIESTGDFHQMTDEEIESELESLGFSKAD